MSEQIGDRHCFVLMPFTVRDEDLPKYGDKNHWSEVYAGLIFPAIHRVSNLDCERDDIDMGSRAIVESIFAKIEAADLIVCDISGFNPNVLFELGWALRSDKKFLLIKDELTNHPFDLSQHYTYTYSHRLQPTAVLKDAEAIAKIAQSTLTDEERRYSVVRRLELSSSAIAAAKHGNIEASLLLDMSHRLDLTLAQNRSASNAIAQDLPALIGKANVVLEAILRRLDSTTAQRDEITLELHRESALLGTQARSDIQFTVIDSEGIIIYHDWRKLIGSHILPVTHVPDVFNDILTHDFGTSAWCDFGNNVPSSPSYERTNVLIFATASRQKWKVLVEVHLPSGS